MAVPVGGSLKDVFTYGSFVHALAGAAGGFTAMTVFFPLDTVRVLLQVDDKREAKNVVAAILEVLREDGIRGLYRGWFPVIVSLFCSNFVYFYTYNLLKALTLTGVGKPSASRDLALATAAGIVNVLVTTPMWVANTRLKLQDTRVEKQAARRRLRYAGVIDALVSIWRSEGARSLWSGTVPSLILVSNPAVQFMVYEALKRKCQHFFRAKELSAVIYFFIGAIAKAISTIVTYPIQVVQSRLRAQCNYSSDREASGSIVECVRHILRVNGIEGLYKGMETKLVQTVLTSALMFLMYEKIAALVFRLMRYQQQLAAGTVTAAS